MRRDRAARIGPALFLFERTFDDCLERIELLNMRFERALLIGCPDPSWPARLQTVAGSVEVADPGPLFAQAAGGTSFNEEDGELSPHSYDLVVAIGTLDTVNELPLALRLIHHALGPNSLFIGAMPGGDTLPLLRAAMRAADALTGTAAPHVHPRIEPAALAPLLEDAGFAKPVVDVDRVSLSYASFDSLIRDLRAMAATNVLSARPRPLDRAERHIAGQAFMGLAEDGRVTETVEILHFAAWSKPTG